MLVAGSYTWGNYRHQSDICHAYQILIKGGVPATNIITFGYDDIANYSGNPLKGHVYNKKQTTAPFNDVYAGCKIDYKGADVTVKNYVAVLKGDSASVGGRPVLKSTSNDNVFLDFSDHGSTGLIAFPHEYMYANTLIDAINFMYNNHMYGRLTYYMEACEAGSMFTSLAASIKAYALTAANDHESSYAYYCPPNDDLVGTTHIGSCLGDEFSIRWMEDTETSDTSKETLGAQFTKVKT